MLLTAINKVSHMTLNYFTFCCSVRCMLRWFLSRALINFLTMNHLTFIINSYAESSHSSCRLFLSMGYIFRKPATINLQLVVSLRF